MASTEKESNESSPLISSAQKSTIFIDLTDRDKPVNQSSVLSRVVPNFDKTRSKVYSLYSWNKDARKWKCNHCLKSYEHHPRNASSILQNHITRSHPTLIKFLEETPNENVETKTHPLFAAVAKKQSVKKPTKTEFRMFLTRFMVSTDQPFSIVEDDTLRDCFKYATMENPELALPTAKHARELIFEMYEEEKKILHSTMKNNPGKISLTVDCWSSANQFPFQGVVASWIDEQWLIHNCVIDLTILEGSHTGANICEALISVLNSYELWEKFLTVTTDNASNMDTMFSKLNEECVKKCVDFSSSDYRVRCLAHVMNLACKEIIKYATGIKEDNAIHETDEELDSASLSSTDIVGLIRKIVVSIRGSPQRREIFRNHCKKHNMKTNMLIRDMKVRWNSTLHMLQRAVQQRTPLMSTIQSVPELNKYKISDQDWEKIEQLIALLKPFEDATLIMSSGDSPTLANTTAVYQVLFEHLEKYTVIKLPNRNRERNAAVSMPQWLQEPADAGWTKLRDYYPSADGLIYTVATVLDPRLKLQYYKASGWRQEWITSAKKAITSLWNKSYKPAPIVEVEVEDGTSVETGGTQLLFQSIFENKLSQFHKPDDELKRYFAEGVVNPKILEKGGIKGALGWWKGREMEYPNLSKMARDFLAIPGTGVPVERLFSSGPDLLGVRRHSLQPETIKKCICLKHWLKMKAKADYHRVFTEAIQHKVLDLDTMLSE